MKRSLFLFVLVLFSLASAGEGRESPSMKGFFREMFAELGRTTGSVKIGPLPAGVRLVDRKGVQGLCLDPGKVEVRPQIWKEDQGLLDRFRSLASAGAPLIAALNGTFYSRQGILGPVIIDGVPPTGVRLFPGSLSRCFFALVHDVHGEHWLLGEAPGTLPARRTALTADGWVWNRALHEGAELRHLLGGGGWIVRDGRDIHMEAYGRQRFRFRREDQDSRHTVLAMDVEDRLYLLVFETGQNLKRVATRLLSTGEFRGITDAIFLDGGSSSTLVVNGNYLVSPLYIIDKARFSALTVVTPH